MLFEGFVPYGSDFARTAEALVHARAFLTRDSVRPVMNERTRA